MNVNTRQIEVRGKELEGMARVLTPDALQFLGKLHHWFNHTRKELLKD